MSILLKFVPSEHFLEDRPLSAHPEMHWHLKVAPPKCKPPKWIRRNQLLWSRGDHVGIPAVDLGARCFCDRKFKIRWLSNLRTILFFSDKYLNFHRQCCSSWKLLIALSWYEHDKKSMGWVDTENLQHLFPWPRVAVLFIQPLHLASMRTAPVSAATARRCMARLSLSMMWKMEEKYWLEPF